MLELYEILGQETAIAQLQQALAGGRMPHSLLFVGPEGVGRETTAVALARTMLCPRPQSLPWPARYDAVRRAIAMPADVPFRQACGLCPDCRMGRALSHPDLTLVYKELAQFHEEAQVRDRKMQDLGIDVIRSFLIAPAWRSSGRGHGRVFVVREADLMSDAAQNSLLKTLEEPPADVTIVLLAERPEQLLATTISRCRQVRFNLLPRDLTAAELARRDIPAPEADFWAAFTAGSIGRSIQLAGHGLYAVKQDLVARLGALAGGKDDALGEHLVAITEKLAGQAIKETRDEDGAEMGKLLAIRRWAAAILAIVASAYSDAMHLATSGDQGDAQTMPIVNADQLTAIQAIAARFDTLQLADILDQLSDLEELLWRNVSPKLVWDNVAITCATAEPLRL